MGRIITKIRKNRKLFLSSGFLLSSGFGLSMTFGYLTAKFIAGPKINEKGRLPSIAFNFKKYRVHLHHWLVFLAALIVSIYINFAVFSPSISYGFFSGIIYQGVSHYDDWLKIVFKDKINRA